MILWSQPTSELIQMWELWVYVGARARRKSLFKTWNAPCLLCRASWGQTLAAVVGKVIPHHFWLLGDSSPISPLLLPQSGHPAWGRPAPVRIRRFSADELKRAFPESPLVCLWKRTCNLSQTSLAEKNLCGTTVWLKNRKLYQRQQTEAVSSRRQQRPRKQMQGLQSTMHLIDRGVNLSNLVLHLLFLYYSNTSARLLPCLDPWCDHTHLFLAQWKKQSWAWVSHRRSSTTTLKIDGVGASQGCRRFWYLLLQLVQHIDTQLHPVSLGHRYS